ncbi:MAG: hypothetical protein ACYCUM_12970 [Solirubrobacteraceae bacterium]
MTVAGTYSSYPSLRTWTDGTGRAESSTQGANPRGEVRDDDELEQMARTTREYGCLQTVRVRLLPGREVPAHRRRAALLRRARGAAR